MEELEMKGLFGLVSRRKPAFIYNMIDNDVSNEFKHRIYNETNSMKFKEFIMKFS